MVGGHYEAIVEKNELKTFQCPDDLMNYYRGERPVHGLSWEGVEMLLVPLNIGNTHWVVMVIDLQEWYIYIFDSDPSTTIPDKIKALVEPFVYMVSKILKQSSLFDHFLKEKEEEEEPLQYSWTLDEVPKQETS